MALTSNWKKYTEKFIEKQILTIDRISDKLNTNQVDHWSKISLKEFLMKYSEFFAAIKSKFMGADVSDICEHLAYQFNIVGEAEGIFYKKVYKLKVRETEFDKTLSKKIKRY